MKIKRIYVNILLGGALVALLLILFKMRPISSKSELPNITIPMVTPIPSATPTPTPTPSPSPLTFAQMQALYGPCVHAPTLMYHHIENMDNPEVKGHSWLTVPTRVFREQMQYLKDKGYTVIKMQDIVNFFDSGTAIPVKSVLLTFDDGYSDFDSDAMPVMREFGYASTLFLPTGLVENAGYLTWNQVNNVSSNGALIANHTWSHKNVAGGDKIGIEHEIMTADGQLSARGFDSPKVFAYPYGPSGAIGVEILKSAGYKLAFTTVPGSTLCKGQRYTLPRVRIGNAHLSTFGF